MYIKCPLCSDPSSMNNTSDTSDGSQHEDACSRWIQLNNDSSTNLTQTQELEFLQACVGPQR